MAGGWVRHETREAESLSRGRAAGYWLVMCFCRFGARCETVRKDSSCSGRNVQYPIGLPGAPRDHPSHGGANVLNEYTNRRHHRQFSFEHSSHGQTPAKWGHGHFGDASTRRVASTPSPGTRPRGEDPGTGQWRPRETGEQTNQDDSRGEMMTMIRLRCLDAGTQAHRRGFA